MANNIGAFGAFDDLGTFEALAASGTTVTPTEATITIETEAPSLLDEHTITPTEATITIETEAPAILDEHTLSPSDDGLITISTEAPTLQVVREITVSPSSEATVTLAVEAPTWVTGLSVNWPIMLRTTRTWVVYGDEAYGKNLIYRRVVYHPMAPEPRIAADSEATITISTEAPTLSVTAGTQVSVTPATATIEIAVEAPSLFQIDPRNSVIGVYRRTWDRQDQYVHTRIRSPHPAIPAQYLPRLKYNGSQTIVRRTNRALWFDFFATTQRTVTPATAAITVETEQVGAQFEGNRTPTGDGTITVLTQSPQIFLDGTSQFASTIAALYASVRRRLDQARTQSHEAAQEPGTRIVYVYAQATPDTLRTPDTATITIETEAPTVVFLNQAEVTPDTATITVEADEPTLDAQADNEPGVATITVATEAPTVVGAIGTRIIPAGSPATVVIDTEVPGLSGINTVVFPGGGGIEATSVLISTGAPTLRITRWTKEPRSVDNWTAESTASDSWEKEPLAANSWNKV